MLSVEDMRSFATPGSGPITGMGSLDEEISAMLQSSHTTLSQASLAGVMAPGDIFSSSLASPYPGALPPGSNPHPAGGLARTSSMSSAGNSRPRPHPNSRTSNHQRAQNQSRRPWAPPMTGDEKWMLDAKGEVLDMHTSAGFDSGFGMMNPPATPPASNSGGLHRYHSAPSAFLQALADEAFSQIPPPPPSANMGPLFSEGGLTPITEVMDVDRMGSGNSVNEFEQFLSPDSDFSRRAAMSALQAKPDNAETFASLFPPAKGAGLVRQKSLPVAPQKLPDPATTEEHQNSEESISGTSDDNSLVSGFMSFSGDTPTSWPTSPGTPGGKRSFPAAWESEISSGGSAENPKSYRPNHHPPGNGLIRHMSLPAASTDHPPTGPPTPPTPSSGDELNQLVQMRARAKRGCATHPRSIAERVRRTRISERMKKLQDLVPNMEKTTNTSDMLDETVQYVRSLQLQVGQLHDTIAHLQAQAQAQAAATAQNNVKKSPG